MGFDIAAWHDYFVATIGAGAALAGLVFVALSINLREILRLPGLVGRAAEALALLLEFVIIGIIGLAPGLDPGLFGLLLLLAGLALWGPLTLARVRALFVAGPPTMAQRLQTLLLVELATVPTVFAGVSLLAGAGGGLYWLVVGGVFALVAGVLDGWVLLIEILR